MIGDASEHVGKPSARVDVVQLAGFEERVDGCGTRPPVTEPAKVQFFAAERDTAHSALCGVVGYADATFVEKRVRAAHASGCSPSPW